MFDYIRAEKYITYDGAQLSAHFAYKNFNILGNSIVVFKGGCRIPYENMVDLEDVINHDEIYSKEMLHFIAEFFDFSLTEMIMLQRIFASLVSERILFETGKVLRRDGDDLFLRDRKLSISIATTTGVSSMFHFAMNLDSSDTPVDTISLGEIGIENIWDFTDKLMECLKKEIKGIRGARCKVIPR